MLQPVEMKQVVASFPQQKRLPWWQKLRNWRPINQQSRKTSNWPAL